MNPSTKDWYKNFRLALSIKVARSSIAEAQQGSAIRALHKDLERLLPDLGIAVSYNDSLRSLAADKVRALGDDISTQLGFTETEKAAFGAAIAESTLIAFDETRMRELVHADATPASRTHPPYGEIKIADVRMLGRELKRQQTKGPSYRA
jgi:hypothetical protein